MLTLRCKAKCTKVKKTSQSPAFKDLRVGDVIHFETDMVAAGYHSNGTKAVYIHCVNERTKLQSKLSFNQLANTLERFEFEEVK